MVIVNKQQMCIEIKLYCKTYRFIQVETAFFWQWWRDQNEGILKKELNKTGLKYFPFALFRHKTVGKTVDQIWQTWADRWWLVNEWWGSCSLLIFDWQHGFGTQDIEGQLWFETSSWYFVTLFNFLLIYYVVISNWLFLNLAWQTAPFPKLKHK